MMQKIDKTSSPEGMLVASLLGELTEANETLAFRDALSDAEESLDAVCMPAPGFAHSIRSQSLGVEGHFTAEPSATPESASSPGLRAALVDAIGFASEPLVEVAEALAWYVAAPSAQDGEAQASITPNIDAKLPPGAALEHSDSFLTETLKEFGAAQTEIGSANLILPFPPDAGARAEPLAPSSAVVQERQDPSQLVAVSAEAAPLEPQLGATVEAGATGDDLALAKDSQEPTPDAEDSPEHASWGSIRAGATTGEKGTESRDGKREERGGSLENQARSFEQSSKASEALGFGLDTTSVFDPVAALNSPRPPAQLATPDVASPDTATTVRRLAELAGELIERRPLDRRLNLSLRAEDGTLVRLSITREPQGAHRLALVVSSVRARDELEMRRREIERVATELPLALADISIEVEEELALTDRVGTGRSAFRSPEGVFA